MYKYNSNPCTFVLEVIYNFGNEKKYIYLKLRTILLKYLVGIQTGQPVVKYTLQ